MEITRLSEIMKHMHIKVSDLAAYIGVHPSLVSRWKNGERPLFSKSLHFNNIVQYILYRDEAAEYVNVKLLLNHYFPDERLESKKVIADVLQKWLAGHNSIKSNNNTDYRDVGYQADQIVILSKDRDKKAAFFNFLDIGMRIPAKRDMFFLYGKDFNEFIKYQSFNEVWFNKFRGLVDCGHTMHFAYYRHQLADLKVYFKHFYKSNCCMQHIGYFVPEEVEYNDSFNLFIMEGMRTITDAFSYIRSVESPLFSFTNYDLVKEMEALFIKNFGNNKLRVATPAYNSKELYSTLDNTELDKGNIYIYDENPFSFPIHSDKFLEILIDNRCTNTAKESYLLKYHNIFIKPMVSKEGKNILKRYILNIDKCIENLNNEINLFLPSLLSSKSITISKKFYIYFLESMIEELESNDSIEIAFVNEDMKLEITEMMMMVKEDSHVYASPYFKELPHYDWALFKHRVLVNHTYNTFDNLWDNIPYEFKDRGMVIDKLKNIIDENISYE